MLIRRISFCLSVLLLALPLRADGQTNPAGTQQSKHPSKEDRLLDKVDSVIAGYIRNKEFANQEKRLLDMMDSVRLERNFQPLKRDQGLCLTFKKELEARAKRVPPPSVLKLEGELLDLASRFGDRALAVEGPEDSLFLYKVLKHPKIQTQVLDSANRSVGLAIQEINDTSYAFLYFPAYEMRYEPFVPETTTSTKAASYPKVILNVKGRTNARYLRFMFYEGLKLPFDYKGAKQETKEVKALPDGSFSVTFEISKFGKADRSIAVFARNKTSEPFILVSLLKGGLEF